LPRLEFLFDKSSDNIQSSTRRRQTEEKMGLAVVVEDEWFIRMQIADMLVDEGWEVVELAAGGPAIVFLESGRRVDLLITDIRMPGTMTGWDVAEAYRASHSEVAVIYCSGNPTETARQVSGSLFMSKPCQMDVLLVAVRKQSKQAGA
jgi:CheY-like chemotaxis protein